MSHFDALQTDKHIPVETWNQALQQIGYVNPEKRGVILRAISRGVEAVRATFQSNNTRRPPIGVPVQALDGAWREHEGRMFYSDVNRAIIVTRRWLDAMNALPLDNEVTITGSENQIAHQGTLEDVCTLMGAEEADHALWRQEGLPNPPRDVSQEVQWRLANYDAIPIEFRALERQVVVAEALKMPQTPTIAILRERIRNAEAVKRTMGA